MGRFDSKKVLHLGHGGMSRYIIDYVKENGAYVIAANNCPKEKNWYRDLADEVVELNIDNNDIVIEYCKANKIDAVFINGSEETYEKARIINEGIGNAFCHTAKQWQTFAKKDNFRKLCIKSGIDVPTTYYSGKVSDITSEILDNISYPIIVKPVDNAGGEGISVVFDKNELDNAIKHAGKNSASSTIIIEEYIVGREVVLVYVVQDGVCKLTLSGDKYAYKNEKNLTSTPELYIYPCEGHDIYLKNTDKKVISMLKGEGLNNCTIFFQAIEKEGKFYFFESGLRFEGSRNYMVTKGFTGQNALHFFCDFLLKTKTNYDIIKDDLRLSGHTLAMYLVHLKKGKIRHIKGKDKLYKNDKFFRITYLRHKGHVIDDDQIGQCFSVYCMDVNDKEELAKQIQFVKKTLKVRGSFYRNMIIDSFDENILIKNK